MNQKTSFVDQRICTLPRLTFRSRVAKRMLKVSTSENLKKRADEAFVLRETFNGIGRKDVEAGRCRTTTLWSYGHQKRIN